MSQFAPISHVSLDYPLPRRAYGAPPVGQTKNPPPYRDGNLLIPRYHPIYPDCIGTSQAGHQHAPSFITGDEPGLAYWLFRVPVLSGQERLQLAAPEGFCSKFGAPASTIPGSLSAHLSYSSPSQLLLKNRTTATDYCQRAPVLACGPIMPGDDPEPHAEPGRRLAPSL